MAMNTDESPATLITFGRKGGMISLASGNAALSPSVKAVAVCAYGDVVYVARNDSRQITMSGLSAGQLLPHIVGMIVAAGTTATLCTIED